MAGKALSEVKYCRVSTLMARWDCSREYVEELLSRNLLDAWQLPGAADNRGKRISMYSVHMLENQSRKREVEPR